MWTAVSLGIAYVAILAGYAGWAVSRVAAGAPAWPFVLGLPLAYLVVPLVFLLIWFALAFAFRSQRPEHARLAPLDAVRMFWREFWTVAGNAPRMIAYRWLLRDPPPAPAELPVLLLHGVLCNAGVWHGLARDLATRGIAPVYTLSYGPPLASIELFAEQTAAKVDAILAETGASQVVLVGHSMGGLVARAYLRRYGGRKVRRLITIGTPHEGSVHAWMFAGTSLAQLRPRNAWLRDLAPPSGDGMPPTVSIWSWHDSMVAPQTSCRVDWGENVELVGVGHNALLASPEVHARIADEIARACGDRRGEPAPSRGSVAAA